MFLIKESEFPLIEDIWWGGVELDILVFYFISLESLIFLSLFLLFIQCYGSTVNHAFFIYQIIPRTHASSKMILHSPSILNPYLLGTKVHSLVCDNYWTFFYWHWLCLYFILFLNVPFLSSCTLTSFLLALYGLMLWWVCLRLRHLFTYIQVIWRSCYSLIPRIVKNMVHVFLYVLLTDLDECVQEFKIRQLPLSPTLLFKYF